MGSKGRKVICHPTTLRVWIWLDAKSTHVSMGTVGRSAAHVWRQRCAKTPLSHFPGPGIRARHAATTAPSSSADHGTRAWGAMRAVAPMLRLANALRHTLQSTEALSSSRAVSMQSRKSFHR